MFLPDCEEPGSLCIGLRQDAVTGVRSARYTVEIEDGFVPVVAIARMPYAPGSKIRLRPAWN